MHYFFTALECVTPYVTVSLRRLKLLAIMTSFSRMLRACSTSIAPPHRWGSCCLVSLNCTASTWKIGRRDADIRLRYIFEHFRVNLRLREHFLREMVVHVFIKPIPTVNLSKILEPFYYRCSVLLLALLVHCSWRCSTKACRKNFSFA